MSLDPGIKFRVNLNNYALKLLCIFRSEFASRLPAPMQGCSITPRRRAASAAKQLVQKEEMEEEEEAEEQVRQVKGHFTKEGAKESSI